MATYSERTAEQFGRVGEAIGGILKDRWDTKEAEDFLQNEFQNFQNSTVQFQNNLSLIEDGDQMASAFLEWKNNTFMPFVVSATARHANNPKIMAMVQQVVEANNKGMDEYLSIEQAGHQLATRGEREEMARRKGEAEIGGMEAEADQRRAGAEESRARAGLLRAQTGAVAQEKLQQQWPNLLAADLPTARSTVQNARINPAYADRVQQIEQRADAAAVARIIQERIGQEKPDGTRWGQDSNKDKEDAMIEWSSSANRNKALEASIAQEMGYNLSTAQGYYDDVLGFIGGGKSPLLPEEKVRPLKAGAKTPVWLGRIFASSSEDLRQRGFNIESPKSFIEETLPDLPMTEVGYRQLGPYVTSVLEQSVIRDADGQIISATTRKPVKNYGELGKHLLASWTQRVTDKQIAPDATALKSDTEQIGKAIIARYAPIIASRLGIPVPQPVLDKLKRAGEPTALRLLRETTSFLGGQVPGLLRTFGFGEEEL